MKRPLFLILFFFLSGLPGLRAQDDGVRFRTILSKGNVTAYRDENDETARLYTNQMVDDGDKLTTGKDSEAVLRMKGWATLYLAPRSRIQFEKLRNGDKGPQCWIRLITGRMVCQLDRPFPGAFEIHAGSVRSHEHGTLFEAIRKGESLELVSYEGSLVADYHGKSKLAKDREVIRMDKGKFRSRSYHLDRHKLADLKAFQDLLERIQDLTPVPGTSRP
ncbi:MAG TPA: FecR domain-containing protein [bacterium]|nr:FecR domain-containing protein [bacterium]